MKLIHTADWQLGKPYGRFEPDVRAALTEARFDAIDAIGKAATLHGAKHVLVGRCALLRHRFTVSETSMFSAVYWKGENDRKPRAVFAIGKPNCPLAKRHRLYSNRKPQTAA